MLDSDIPGSDDQSADGATAAPEPRKRAPRKRAARTNPTTPEPDAAASSAEPQPAEAQPAEAQPAEAQPAEAPPRPRKRAAKKATTTAPPPAAETAENGEPRPDIAEPTPAAADIEATTAPPTRRTPRKRAAKKMAASPELAVGTAEDSPAAPSAGAAPVAPAVLFQAPAAAAPAGDSPADGAAEPAPRRRRATKKPAAPAVDEASTPPAESVGPDLAAAEDAEDTEDTDDEVADPEDVREIASEQASGARRRRRRGRRGRGGARGTDQQDDDAETGQGTDTATGTAQEATPADTDEPAAEASDESAGDADGESSSGTRRRRRRRRTGTSEADTDTAPEAENPPKTVTHVRERRGGDDGVRAVKGSTRLEAKRQRRRDGRESTRRRAPILTEAEFLARREAVDRVMAVRQNGSRTQIAVLEDGVLVEHYVTRASSTSYVGNVYLGRVQNVLPSMEAAFIDIGKGRNGVLYAGEVNWDAAGLEGKARTIEQALKSGDPVLVQVTKDPIGHKGARLTSQISLPGRFLVYVPGGGMTGISRRLPDTERHRLKAILKKIVPDEAGVIVRTAAEGASEEDLTHDVERLRAQWDVIQQKATQTKAAPTLVHGEPDLAIRVVRDVFNEDFAKLVVQGEQAWATVSEYVRDVAPDLGERVAKHVGTADLFAELRVDEQLMKALDRKVWLPSGGSLVIDRTEAMTVIDVNTGKFVGAGGNLEQTVTRNNLEAAEEVVRQLRLRDVGGIVVIDFIDMVLESNRELVLRRLTECLGRDRTKHQVAEVTSLGLVQMTRKRVGEGLLEAFSEPCEVCHGRGVIVHTEPVDKPSGEPVEDERPKSRRKRGKNGAAAETADEAAPAATPEQRHAATAAIAAIHRAASGENGDSSDDRSGLDELATGLVAAALKAERGSRPDADADNARQDPTAAAVDAVAGVETADQAVPAAQPVPAESDAAGAGQVGGRRRRRAASRPAGPPISATG
jgi:ribonuclease E